MKYNFWNSYSKIVKTKISEQLELGHNKFVIYPFGDIGVLTKYILNNVFNINEEYIIDNSQANNQNIFSLQDAKWERDIYILICSENSKYYHQIRESILQFVPAENVIDLFEDKIGRASCRERVYEAV